MENRVIIAKDIEDREKAFSIRRKVFIEEQNVPEELEIDEYDESPDTQCVLLLDSEGSAAGTARFRPYGDDMLKIERVAVLKEQRRNGAGKAIMAAVEAEAEKAGYPCVKLAAQLHARGFYERLGYQAFGETYLEAGIEHVDMVKRIK